MAAGFLFAHGGDAMVAGRPARSFETASCGIVSPVFFLHSVVTNKRNNARDLGVHP